MIWWIKLHIRLGGVSHCDDLQYLFTISANSPYFGSSTFPIYNDSDREIAMVKQFTSMWAHFAKTGEPLPNNSDLFGNVTWDRFTPDNRSYLDIGKGLVMKTAFLSDAMRFWDNVFP